MPTSQGNRKVKVKVKSLSRVALFVTPWTVAYQDPQWDFPAKNTGVGYHFLLQGIFPTQGLNLGLPHCRQTPYRLLSGSLTQITQPRDKADF